MGENNLYRSAFDMSMYPPPQYLFSTDYILLLIIMLCHTVDYLYIMLFTCVIYVVLGIHFKYNIMKHSIKVIFYLFMCVHDVLEIGIILLVNDMAVYELYGTV